MALFTKCILDEEGEGDGFRISIMSRHTYDDGISERPELDEMCDKHYSILGPSPSLIGSWKRGDISWEEYEQKYIKEIMDSLRAMSLLEAITRIAMFSNVTFLCIESSCKECHRRLLAKICQKIQPALSPICR